MEKVLRILDETHIVSEFRSVCVLFKADWLKACDVKIVFVFCSDNREISKNMLIRRNNIR